MVVADRAYSGDYLDDAPAHLQAIGEAGTLSGPVVGEWMGLARFSAKGLAWLHEEIAALQAEGLLDSADLPLLFTRLAAKHPVRVKYFTGHWVNVETLRDLAEARDFA